MSNETDLCCHKLRLYEIQGEECEVQLGEAKQFSADPRPESST